MSDADHTVGAAERFPLHEEAVVRLEALPEDVFALVDDHARLSAHMDKPSWQMAGAKMTTTTDQGHGQRVGSHIRMEGRVLGLRLGLDEVVTEREPPHRKAWETVGEPRLLVVGPYRMSLDVAPAGPGARLRVGIDYARPSRHPWLGRLFGRPYARWCVGRMARDVEARFAQGSP
jgi:hypothetical protein